jgi:hypothetical protein
VIFKKELLLKYLSLIFLCRNKKLNSRRIG